MNETNDDDKSQSNSLKHKINPNVKIRHENVEFTFKELVNYLLVKSRQHRVKYFGILNFKNQKSKSKPKNQSSICSHKTYRKTLKKVQRKCSRQTNACFKENLKQNCEYFFYKFTKT